MPKCQSAKIGYLENIIHRTAAQVGSQSVRGHCPAPVGITETKSGRLIKVIKKEPVGELEAYCCTACGYFETDIKNPSEIPYDSILGYKSR